MRNRKKILICVPTLATGGAEKSLVSFINEYCEEYEIYLLVYTERNNYYARDIKGVEIDYFMKENYPLLIEKISNRILKYLPIKWCYRFVLNKTKFKNIHFDIEFAYLEGRPTKIIAGSTNKKSLKLAYIHCDFSKNRHSVGRYVNHKQEYNAYKMYDKILAVSNSQKEAFEQLFLLDTLQVIPNLIDEQGIIDQAKETILEDNVRYFCAVGRLVEVKRFDLLIRAFHEFRKSYPHYKLFILGEGELKEKLNILIKKLGEEENIILKGFQRNPYKYIKNSVALIQTSESESFGYVLAEAAILGIPVLATKTQGSEYMKNYFHIEEIDANEHHIVEVMKKVVSNRKLTENSLDINNDIKKSFLELFNNEN